MQVKLLKMEASCNFCSSIYTLAPSCLSLRFRQKRSNLSSFIAKNRTFLDSISIRATASSSSSGGGTKAVTTRRRKPKNGGTNGGSGKNAKVSEIPAVSTKGSSGKVVDKVQVKRKKQQEECFQDDGPVNVRALHQNGDPLGRKDLGKCVVRWLSQGMRAMALDFVTAEMQGEFAELKQRMEPGLTFVIQAQPYINAVPMPLGLEAICLKACTHYPTLFDNFQRELREVLQDFQSKSSVQDWRETESWKLLKDLASSAQHKAIARKESQPKSVPGVMGMDLEKAKAIQSRIDDFANRMSDLLHIERDAELEFTQEELNAVPAPDVTSEAQKPLEFLVSHAQPEQELCDTICNLTAVSTSIGLGGMHLVLFKLEGNHRLPPTNLSPGDMVCVRICDSRGAGATSCMQGFVHNLGEDERSISLALESLQGDTTFSKLFGKNVRIDRIQGLADALTYERNCEALMMLQKKGFRKKNPSVAVVATLFGDKEDHKWLEENDTLLLNPQTHKAKTDNNGRSLSPAREKMAILFQSSSSSMLSIKVFLISTTVLSAAIMLKVSAPVVTEFAVSEVPSIWNGVVSWLKPPYLYLVINCIIITIVASSKLQNKLDENSSPVPAVVSPENSSQFHPIKDVRPVTDYYTPVLHDLNGSVLKNQAVEAEARPIVYEYPTAGVYDAKVEKLPVVNPYISEKGTSFNTYPEPNDVVAEKDDFVISKSSWAPVMRQDSIDYSISGNSAEKPPASARFAHRRNVKSTPEGGKGALRVSKPKRQDTLESTWKTITEGRAMPLTRHLRKSDTWETYGGRNPVTPPPQKMKKSETFNDRTTPDSSPLLTPSPGGSGKLKKEPSLSQDELNRRVEAFIKKFNEDMRLQRQQSMQQYTQMINRGSH